MKKNKILNFKINGKIVETIEASEITIDCLKSFKSSIAVMNRVSYDEVEVESKDVEAPELSLLMVVRPDGTLMRVGDVPGVTKFMPKLIDTVDCFQSKVVINTQGPA